MCFIIHSRVFPGVLGGFGAVTPVDVKESNQFLDKILDLRPTLQLNRVAGELIQPVSSSCLASLLLATVAYMHGLLQGAYIRQALHGAVAIAASLYALCGS
jgi:hypothetical protein